MKTKILFLIAILFVVAGCSSTALIGSWIDPEVKSIEGKSIAIFCLTPRLGVRDKVETQMAASFLAKGYIVGLLRNPDRMSASCLMITVGCWPANCGIAPCGLPTPCGRWQASQ